MSTDIRLDFGPVGASLDLVDADQLADQRPFWFHTLADGFNLGSPQASRIIVASLMRDGDDERIDRYGNRTVTFDVQVHARTPHDLGLGEKALGRLVGTRTLLRWTPPGDVGSLTRFVVLTSEMAQVPNDLDEMREIRTRTWRLTLTCEPHGTSEAPVSQTFAPATTPPTTVDNASTTTRWTCTEDLSTTTYGDGTSLRFYVTLAFTTSASETITYTSPTAMTSTYVGIDVKGNKTSVTLDGAEPVSVEPGTFYQRFWFARKKSTVQAFRVRETGDGQGVKSVPVYVGGLYSSNTLSPASLSVTEVEGSVRTEGSLTVTRASSMAWLVAYSDPTMLASSWSPSTQATWALAPAGRYMVAAMGASVGSATGTLVTTVTDSSGLVQTATTFNTVATAGYRPLGEFSLGSRRDGTLGALTVSVTRDGAAQTPLTLRLFRIGDDTSLTMVEPATAVTEYALEAPSLDRPLGGLFAGGFAAEDRALSWENPIMPAGTAALYVEAPSSSTVPVATTLDYWPRWKGFAP